jgi:hypothetical protein
MHGHRATAGQGPTVPGRVRARHAGCRTATQSSEIWHHLGGWYDEGDTYDTQEVQFEQDLNHFWAKLRGPDENLRCRLLGATEGLGTDWKSVVIVRNGNVRIRYAKKRVKTITPPKSTP